MLPSFDKLNKMLTQEKILGYENKAVFGGLEKFAPNWAKEALAEATTAEQRRVVDEVVQDLNHYPEVAAENRPNYIHQILVKLHKAGNDQPRPDKPVPAQAEKTQGQITEEQVNNRADPTETPVEKALTATAAIRAPTTISTGLEPANSTS